MLLAAWILAPAPGATSERIVWDVVRWDSPAKEVLAGAGYAVQRVRQDAAGTMMVLTVAGPDVRTHWTAELAAALLRAGGVASITVEQVCRGAPIATVVNTLDARRRGRFEVHSATSRPLPADLGARTCWLSQQDILQAAMAAAKQDQRLARHIESVRERGGRVFVMIEAEPEPVLPGPAAVNTFFTVQLGGRDDAGVRRLATLVVQPVTGDVLAEGDAGFDRDLATLRPLPPALP